MGKETGILWTSHTFNPVWGCTRVSPACDFCYAADMDKHWYPVQIDGVSQPSHWGKGILRREFGDKHWDEPLKWNKDAAKDGIRSKVFCGSMCDVMDDEWPDGIRERLWTLIDNTPNLIWQLLTKRPHRYSRYLPERFKHWNVWLGTSAENQKFYDVRWPILAQQRTRFAGMVPVFISYEPALGPVTLSKHAHLLDVGVPDWIIFGGESGSNRRPMEQWWAENLLFECRGTGVRFFMKQLSARTPEEGAKLIPPHLLVREFPQ